MGLPIGLLALKPLQLGQTSLKMLRGCPKNDYDMEKLPAKPLQKIITQENPSCNSK